MQSYRRKCRKFRFVNSAPAERGARTAAGVFAPNGRHLFLHRLSGVLEPRRRFTLTGGEFFAEPQQGIRRLRTAGTVPRPAAGTTPYPRRRAKRKGHLRFPFLFELLPFPCFLIWRRFPICDRFEKENGRGFFLPCFSQPVRSVRYCTATLRICLGMGAHCAPLRKKKSSAVPLFRSGHMSAICARPSKGKG